MEIVNKPRSSIELNGAPLKGIKRDFPNFPDFKIDSILIIFFVCFAPIEIRHKQGERASVRGETKTYCSRMNPPPSGLVWGWFWGLSGASLEMKLAMLGGT